MRTRPSPAFTLVEVILAVVILAIAATMAGLFASTSMGRGATGSLPFNDEITLRNALEDINIHYKARIAADSMTLTDVASYARTHYPSMVNNSYTGYLSFSDADDDKTYTPSSLSGAYTSGLALLVTLTKNDQTLAAMYTD